MQLNTGLRLAARALFPNRDWAPIEAWDDERYNALFQRIKAQPDDLEAQRRACVGVSGPLFSIVVPLYQTPQDYLDDMAESVLSQTYPNFELILVNASPELEELRRGVSEYALRDNRVKVVELEENLGITENTNQGIDVAEGQFICFIDHDDWLEPDALFEFAAALNEHADIDVLYSDEDLVERHGKDWRHCHPMLKPDFAPELLMCKNYIVHFMAVRKSVIDSLPRPSSEYDGSQDYNMALRATGVARRVHHVQRVLYHWRMSSNSAATNPAAKPYARRSAMLSIRKYLERKNTPAVIVETGIAHVYNVWFHPDEDEKVSVVITCSDDGDCKFLAMALEAFEQTNSYDNLEIIVVGAPGDLTIPKTIASCVRLVAVPENSTMYERLNVGARKADGGVLVFLDERSAFATPEPIEQLVGLLSCPGVGIVAPKVLYSNNRVKHFGIGVSKGAVPLYRGYPLDHHSYLCNLMTFQNCAAVGYQGLAIRKSLFEDVGMFDNSYSGEIVSVALCGSVFMRGLRLAALSSVEMLTTEKMPDRLYDANVSHADYPVEDIERLHEQMPVFCSGAKAYENPGLCMESGYPVLNLAPMEL